MFRSIASMALVTGMLLSSPLLAQQVKDEYEELEQKELLSFQAGDNLGASPFPGSGSSGNVVRSFDGISQYDVAAVARSFIPPDTMGAVGLSQYMETSNGGYAVYDKATGARTSFVSDVAFWATAGQIGANGDSRVMFDKASSRWIATSFGANVSDIQIAVSTTSNALGPWTSTKFTGFAGGTADFPTLALDNNAVYIGTNNFNAAGKFAGTTLNVIPLSDVFGAGAPNASNRAVFNTSYVSGSSTNADRGYAIQGVNSTSLSTDGHIQAVSLFDADLVGYDVKNAGTLVASLTATLFAGANGYDANDAARQPNAVLDVAPAGGTTFPSNDRVIDTSDDRVGSSVYEVNGKIYSVHTVTPTGSDYTAVRWTITDAVTKKVLGEGDIGDSTHDFYQGSLSVNSQGQVVIGYDRSGSDPADGRITFAARIFRTAGNTLVQFGDEQVLRISLVDDYHNGSFDGQIALGRQRWGDYSAVSLDPTDESKFWVIGEYAREYNDAAGGHPGGTGGSRWGTWISEIDVGSVPEPSSWMTMILGLGVIGTRLRRRPAVLAVHDPMI